MPQQNPEHLRATAGQILTYFVRHPRAADDLEGVARWRLLQEQRQRNLAEISEALAWLVRQGLLRSEAPLGAEPIFSLNSDKADEATAFLQDLESRGSRD